MIMQTTNPFEEVPIAGFVGIILDGGERANEAMYYLLQYRLYQPLKRRYKIFQKQILDDFDNILNDFFFYLRGGRNSHGGDEGNIKNEGDRKTAKGVQHPFPTLLPPF